MTSLQLCQEDESPGPYSSLGNLSQMRKLFRHWREVILFPFLDIFLMDTILICLNETSWKEKGVHYDL